MISKILLANPRGFCAGVDRAILVVERALEQWGVPLYVRHAVVHNRYVVEGLTARGVIFVEELSEVPAGNMVVFSAHGVSEAVRQEAKARGLTVFDATCPLVTKVHMEVVRHARQGRDCILIGHKGHPEVLGTMGQYPEGGLGKMYLVENVADVAVLEVRDPSTLAYVTQTTLSVDDTQAIIVALKQRFPEIQVPRKEDICYATQNRQVAVKQLAELADVVFVVGSTHSSNANRLQEVAALAAPAYLIDGVQDIQPQWLQGVQVIGITAGASTPESLVQALVAHFQALGAKEVNTLEGEPENVSFALPANLRRLDINTKEI